LPRESLQKETELVALEFQGRRIWVSRPILPQLTITFGMGNARSWKRSVARAFQASPAACGRADGSRISQPFMVAREMKV